MHCHDLAIAGRHAATRGVRGLLIAAFAVALAGCNTTASDTTGTISTDYRTRHPISVKESNRTLTVFVGAGRGGLSPMQRAEVLSFAQNWRREATGGITIERPVDSPNERAARDSLKEALSIIAAAGIPQHGIGIRPYHATANKTATLRFNYPLMRGVVGPCGRWPDDLGPTYNPNHIENRQYHNFGCATQRNLASMVDNPSDLVQPRAETPAYTAKRSISIDKWRKGQSPATVYPDSQKGAISELGR